MKWTNDKKFFSCYISLVIHLVILNAILIINVGALEQQNDNTIAIGANVDKLLDSEFDEYISKTHADQHYEWSDNGTGDTFEMEDEEEDENSEEFGGEVEDDLPRKKLIKPAYLYSPNSMKKLAEMEAGIYSEVKKYMEKLQNRMELMKQYTKDYEESLIKGPDTTFEKQQHATLANPFVSHRIIRRFAINFLDIMKTFRNFSDDDFIEAVNAINNEIIYPNEENDYTDSLKSLLRIQWYNNFDTYEFSNGKLEHMQSSVGLQSVHAFNIGIHAGVLGYVALGIEWFEVALKKIEEEGNVNEEFRQLVQHHLEESVAKHDESFDDWARDILGDFTFLEKIGSNFGPHLPNRIKAVDVKKKEAILRRNVSAEYGFHIRNNFLTLCSGENIQTEYEKSQLYCWNDNSHPYWRINPLRKELLNKVPPLVQIYDVLDKKIIQKIIDSATPDLIRSKVINFDDHKRSDVSDVRTSVQTWLEEENYPFFEKIMKKIEFITGLNVRKKTASETIQVARYFFSNLYDEHLDALLDPKRTMKKGDRIATLMFYLTDVEEGGKTGFPWMGVATSPIAGSAVFWYNLMENGVPDKRTWHGGCPVVHGIKWVANKWILSHENWEKRKCSLNSED